VEELFGSIAIAPLASFVSAVALYLYVDSLGHASATAMAIWLVAMVAATAGHLLLLRAYRRRKPEPAARHGWLVAFTLTYFIIGVGWGVGSLLMVTPEHFDVQLFISLTIAAILYSSLSGFGSYWPFYALLFPATIPLAVWSAFQPGVGHIAFAVLNAIWIPVVAWLAQRHALGVQQFFNLRHENLELLEDLQIEKERAEQANISKSRFLASASHDLRQPVHALGMFVGALKGYPMGDRARRLLNHIEGSVSALDGLFTSLLDISRLDAGVIAVNAVSFPIAPLLERICRDLGEEARKKGLKLALVECSELVDSDPLLLERILRNVISNAVKYTHQGHVLVGCRREGAMLRIQVWDTGPGIPIGLQERVFEEFYQLGNEGRDRSQGLGLGLAIVRRLTRLLHHPLRLKSEEGRGAMFEIGVPIGAPERVALPEAKPSSRPSQGLVLVIDDEAAICEAMKSLLESWGYDVIAARSGAAMLEQVANVTQMPALIISDYRLLDGENGIAVIRMLQSEFNDDDIPAMLITGDTAKDRLSEARDSGFLLLHKPLSAEQLRVATQSVTSRVMQDAVSA
jgi:signal transduction histidine kinase/CheY-like chemotaxis protein